MLEIHAQLIGCVTLVISSIAFGILLRKHSSKSFAEAITIVMHLVTLFAYLFPFYKVLSHGNITHYDVMLGIPILEFQSGLKIVGMVMILLGICFILISFSSLLEHGRGLPGFILSQELASVNIYAYIRNPMSLGFYLTCTAIGLITGSTFFTLWSLTVIIPAHICFLKFFEERELESRFGRPYIEYKKRVPFLIPKYRDISKPNNENHDV
jgi:protein-S-isoprenylcysteine O-methyltransferase Ste14